MVPDNTVYHGCPGFSDWLQVGHEQLLSGKTADVVGLKIAGGTARKPPLYVGSARTAKLRISATARSMQILRFQSALFSYHSTIGT